ncbi:MAG: hypothetical protein H6742_16840 [Alphaproteobacteria bacterium]|nr:hypothetical protein [Alphaproteobacteria bacterium]
MNARDALITAMIPAPGDGLPALGDLDLRGFWPRFQAAAPWHLRAGLALCTVVVGTVLPLLLRGRRLATLDADGRDAVLQRADRLPLCRDLLEVARLVACLAYFDDDGVQAAMARR